MPKIVDENSDEIFMTDVDSVTADFKHFSILKREIETLKKLQDEVKARLMEILDRYGDEDDKGHLWYDFEMPVDGYKGMQKQRRVSQKLDEDAAEEILTKKGLYDACYVLQPVLQEDAVMACLYEGLLTEEDIDTMFPKTVNWAFVPTKE